MSNDKSATGELETDPFGGRFQGSLDMELNDGPMTTIIDLNFHLTTNHLDDGTDEGRIWHSYLVNISKEPLWNYTILGHLQPDSCRQLLFLGKSENRVAHGEDSTDHF